MKTFPVVLLTDFGTRDHYSGVLKGVVLSISSDIPVVDLSHEISPQNILQGAIVLRNAYRYFPVQTVFVCVVDPGVGTERRILAAEAGGRFFVAPDNGLLTPVLQAEANVKIFQVSRKEYFFSQQASATFHGRDMMAPAGAHLACGLNPERLGPEVKDYQKLSLPPIERSKNGLRGVVLCFDHYGNAVTNISRNEYTEENWRKATVWVKGEKIGRLQHRYADASGRLMALINSAGDLEIAYPMGSAREQGNLSFGDEVQVQL